MLYHVHDDGFDNLRHVEASGAILVVISKTSYKRNNKATPVLALSLGKQLAKGNIPRPTRRTPERKVEARMCESGLRALLLVVLRLRNEATAVELGGLFIERGIQHHGLLRDTDIVASGDNGAVGEGEIAHHFAFNGDYGRCC